jgi:hypothetical protein
MPLTQSPAGVRDGFLDRHSSSEIFTTRPKFWPMYCPTRTWRATRRLQQTDVGRALRRCRPVLRLSSGTASSGSRDADSPAAAPALGRPADADAIMSLAS